MRIQKFQARSMRVAGFRLPEMRRPHMQSSERTEIFRTPERLNLVGVKLEKALKSHENRIAIYNTVISLSLLINLGLRMLEKGFSWGGAGLTVLGPLLAHYLGPFVLGHLKPFRYNGQWMSFHYYDLAQRYRGVQIYLQMAQESQESIDEEGFRMDLGHRMDLEAWIGEAKVALDSATGVFESRFRKHPYPRALIKESSQGLKKLNLRAWKLLGPPV